MKDAHQKPFEAVEGMQLCKKNFAVGHHFGTFQLTHEEIDAPEKALKTALKDAEIDEDRFRPLTAGESFDVPQAPS